MILNAERAAYNSVVLWFGKYWSSEMKPEFSAIVVCAIQE